MEPVLRILRVLSHRKSKRFGRLVPCLRGFVFHSVLEVFFSIAEGENRHW